MLPNLFQNSMVDTIEKSLYVERKSNAIAALSNLLKSISRQSYIASVFAVPNYNILQP